MSGDEQVIIVREPTNQYDSNAIRVLNVRRHQVYINNHRKVNVKLIDTQVGHIPRQLAAKITSFIVSLVPSSQYTSLAMYRTEALSALKVYLPATPQRTTASYNLPFMVAQMRPSKPLPSRV